MGVPGRFLSGAEGNFRGNQSKLGLTASGIELAVMEPGWFVVAPEGAGGRGGTAKSLGERRLSSGSIPPSSKKRGGIEMSNEMRMKLMKAFVTDARTSRSKADRDQRDLFPVVR